MKETRVSKTEKTVSFAPLSAGFILSFPFEKRWLRGEEYGFLCRHYYAYSEVFKIFKVIDGNHPEEIYHEPKCKYNFESLSL